MLRSGSLQRVGTRGSEATGTPALAPADPALKAEMQRWVDPASLTGDKPVAASRESAGNAVPAYWDRLRARPSYRAVVLDHAHPTVTRGRERLRAAKAANEELRRLLETADAT